MNALLLLTCAALAADADSPPSKATVLVVVGLEGEEEYGQQFRQWAERWQAAAEQGNAEFVAIGLDEPGEKSDRELLQERLGQWAKESAEPLWLVFIGHGTFDGKTARFNLRGNDISPAELAPWLAKIQRPLAFVNCASASAPFMAELSRDGRIMITSTRSGFEYNFARFGDYLSAAIADPAADLDKDDQTSLLEAFLRASSRVKEFYAQEGRLETEHPLIDDNGDRLGTPPDWFKGVRAVKAAKDGATIDGTFAGQLCLVPSQREELLSEEVRTQRNELENELAELRQRKADLSEDEYLAQLEPILVQIARLYEGESVKAGK
jgi:hypothetical protein